MTTRPMSKLTSKYQTTVPAAVRAALSLQKGDAMVFEIDEDGRVTMCKAVVLDLPFATALEPLLSEWDSAADDEAYSGL